MSTTGNDQVVFGSMIQTNAFMKHNYACSTQMSFTMEFDSLPKNIFSKLTMTLKFVECVRCLYKTCRVHVSIASIKSKSTKHGLKILGGWIVVVAVIQCQL